LDTRTPALIVSAVNLAAALALVSGIRGALWIYLPCTVLLMAAALYSPNPVHQLIVMVFSIVGVASLLIAPGALYLVIGIVATVVVFAVHALRLLWDDPEPAR
jgi:hypothetical protein